MNNTKNWLEQLIRRRMSRSVFKLICLLALVAQVGGYTPLSGTSIIENVSAADLQIPNLRNIPLFADLDEAFLQSLAAHFVTENYPAGELVIRQGELGDKFYVIASGAVKITMTQSSGEQQELAVLKEGDYFGEIALLSNIPRTATVTTQTPSVLLTLTRDQFQQLLATAPDVKQQLETEMKLRLDRQKQ